MSFWNRSSKTGAKSTLSMQVKAAEVEKASKFKYVLTDIKKNVCILSAYKSMSGKNPASYNVSVTRIRALIDIPAHNVKSGDLGGWVKTRDILSQEGDAWIGGEAIVAGLVTVNNNALVTDQAIVFAPNGSEEIFIQGNAIVRGNAVLTNEDSYPYDNAPLIISDYALVEGNAKLINANMVANEAIVSEYAILSRGVIVNQKARVYGKAFIDNDCSISGTSIVFGNTKVQPDTTIEGSSKIGFNNTSRELLISGRKSIINQTCKSWGEYHDNSNEPMLKYPPVREVQAPIQKEVTSTQISHSLDQTKKLFLEIEANIDSYQNDIVKLIKYPAMLDKSKPEVLDMFIALASVKRFPPESDPRLFSDAVFELEKKYMIAESVAQKIAGSLFTNDEKKKVKKAQDLLSIAMDSASAEQEKRVAVKQTLNQLEGVIPLEQNTVQHLYRNVGLREIAA